MDIKVLNASASTHSLENSSPPLSPLHVHLILYFCRLEVKKEQPSLG